MSWLPDWLTGYDRENAQRAEQAEARLKVLNLSDGLVYGPEWVEAVNANYAAQEQFTVEAQDDAIGTAFAQGAAEGLKSTQDKFKGFLNGLGLGVLGFIPWWAWLVAAGYLAWKLGAVDWLKRRIARA